MSRVGKQAVTIPAKVTVKLNGAEVQVEGPKGKLSHTLPACISMTQDAGVLKFDRSAEDRKTRALHGTSQRLVGNMIKGVSEGFRKDLEIHGVGFRSAIKEDKLDLSLGYSHPLLHPIPADIKVTLGDANGTKIAVEGIDKQRVGQFAADIRNYYPPEPYKGKGVRYAGEQVRRKEGKKTK